MTSSFTRGARSYVTGLLVRVHNANCVRLAASVGVSHDHLSRVLKTKDGRVSTHVSTLILRTLGKFSGGSLIIDDTTITKIFARVIEGCSWLWSSNDERVVFGYQVVVLLWSNGTLSIPLRWEFYKKIENKDENQKQSAPQWEAGEKTSSQSVLGRNGNSVLRIESAGDSARSSVFSHQ